MSEEEAAAVMPVLAGLGLYALVFGVFGAWGLYALIGSLIA